MRPRHSRADACGVSRPTQVVTVPCGKERSTAPPKCVLRCRNASECHHPHRQVLLSGSCRRAVPHLLVGVASHTTCDHLRRAHALMTPCARRRHTPATSATARRAHCRAQSRCRAATTRARCHATPAPRARHASSRCTVDASASTRSALCRATRPHSSAVTASVAWRWRVVATRAPSAATPSLARQRRRLLALTAAAVWAGAATRRRSRATGAKRTARCPEGVHILVRLASATQVRIPLCCGHSGACVGVNSRTLAPCWSCPRPPSRHLCVCCTHHARALPAVHTGRQAALPLRCGRRGARVSRMAGHRRGWARGRRAQLWRQVPPPVAQLPTPVHTPVPRRALPTRRRLSQARGRAVPLRHAIGGTIARGGMGGGGVLLPASVGAAGCVVSVCMCVGGSVGGSATSAICGCGRQLFRDARSRTPPHPLPLASPTGTGVEVLASAGCPRQARRLVFHRLRAAASV